MSLSIIWTITTKSWMGMGWGTPWKLSYLSRSTDRESNCVPSRIQVRRFTAQANSITFKNVKRTVLEATDIDLTRYGLDGQKFETGLWQDIFSSSPPQRPALETS